MSGKNVPVLRFPEFEGDWERTPLSAHFASMDAGVSVNSENRPAGENELGILKTSCLTGSVFRPFENKAVTRKVEKRRLKQPVVGDTIVMSRMNTPALVGENAYVPEDMPHLFLPDRLWAAKPKSGSSMRFLSFILGGGRTRAMLSMLGTGTSGSMKNISKTDVMALRVVTPKSGEQEKIAAFLGAVDEKIYGLEKKRALLTEYKRGVMRKFFSQELRFKDDQGRDLPDWEDMPFAQIAKRVGEKFDPNKDDDRPVLIELENLASGTGQIFGHSDLAAQKSLKSRFEAGDVLFGKLRPYLRKFARPEFPGVCSSEIWILRGQAVSNEFLFQMVQGEQFNQLANMSSGSKMPRADWKVIADSEFSIPSEAEQRKIAGFLSAIDDQIARTGIETEEAKIFKKGLLQQMFV